MAHAAAYAAKRSAFDFTGVQALKHDLESAFDNSLSPMTVLEAFADISPDDRFVRSMQDVPLRFLGNVMNVQDAAIVSHALRQKPLTIAPSRIVAQSAQIPPPRLSVGYRLAENDGFEFEVRLQHANAQSVVRARTLVRERTGRDATIGVLSKITAYSGGAHPAALNNAPLTLGSSIAHANGVPGSLGVFARSGKTVGFLSCSHVLANAGSAKAGDAIYHPAPNDNPVDHSPVATLRRFVDLRGSGPITMDAAFAAIEDKANIGDNVVPKGEGWRNEGRALGETIRGPIPKVRPVLAKIGRSSAYSEGELSLENVGPIDIFFPELGQNITVTGLIEVRWTRLDKPFSQDGDSGSLVYLAESLEPVGILIAGGVALVGNTKVGMSYACPLSPILKTWNLTLN